MLSLSEKLAITSKYCQSSEICTKNTQKIFESKRLALSIIQQWHLNRKGHNINKALYASLINIIVFTVFNTKRRLKRKMKNFLIVGLLWVTVLNWTLFFTMFQEKSREKCCSRCIEIRFWSLYLSLGYKGVRILC